MQAVLKYDNFVSLFIVWGGQLISVLGTGLTQFGLFFFVFGETASVTSLAMVILAIAIALPIRRPAPVTSAAFG